MDALDLEHTHILGWSMGTQIALELALDHPEKVDKLILYSANCGGDEGIFPDPEVTDKFRNISGTPEERAQRAFEVLLPEQWLAERPNPGAYFPNVTETSPQEHIDAQWYAMVNWNGSYRRLPQITQDTILITGQIVVGAGPVLSYYEFKHPMDDRLTDDKWRAMLNSEDLPEQPGWVKALKG